MEKEVTSQFANEQGKDFFSQQINVVSKEDMRIFLYSIKAILG